MCVIYVLVTQVESRGWRGLGRRCVASSILEEEEEEQEEEQLLLAKTNPVTTSPTLSVGDVGTGLGTLLEGTATRRTD